MMKKKHKAAFVGVSIIIVSMSLVPILQRFSSNDPESAMRLIKIVDKLSIGIKKVMIHHRGETPFTIESTPQGYFVINHDFTFDQEKIDLVFTALSDFDVEGAIGLTGTLKDYGLTDPTATITVTYLDGEIITILIGNKTPIGNSRYALIGRDSPIYILRPFEAEELLNTYYDYRKSMVVDADDIIKSVSFTIQGNITLELKRFFPANSWQPSVFQITKPVKFFADDYSVNEKILKRISLLSLAEVVEDNPANLLLYGLQNSGTYIKIQSSTGSYRLLAGKKAGAKTFIMREGIPAVLQVDSRLLNFLQVNYFGLALKTLWLYPMKGLLRVEITASGKTKTIKWDDSTKVSEEHIQFFRTLLSIPIVGQCGKPQGPAEYVFRLIYADTVYEAAFTGLNERQYAATLNGDFTGVFVSRVRLDEIVTWFNPAKTKLTEE